MSILITHAHIQRKGKKRREKRPLCPGDLCISLVSQLTPPSRVRAPTSWDPEPGPAPSRLPGKSWRCLLLSQC